MISEHEKRVAHQWIEYCRAILRGEPVEPITTLGDQNDLEDEVG